MSFGKELWCCVGNTPALYLAVIGIKKRVLIKTRGKRAKEGLMGNDSDLRVKITLAILTGYY